MRGDGTTSRSPGSRPRWCTYVRKHPDVEVADVAASFQEAVVDVLVDKLVARPPTRPASTTLVIGGGVAANSRLRARVARGRGAGLRVVLPRPALCTDNGAMIAAAAWWRLRATAPPPLDDGADPNLRLGLTGALAPGAAGLPRGRSGWYALALDLRRVLTAPDRTEPRARPKPLPQEAHR